MPSFATALNVLRYDSRFAMRGFRRRPVWAATVVTTLALGIGANELVVAMEETGLLSSGHGSGRADVGSCGESRERERLGHIGAHLRSNLRSIVSAGAH